MATQSDWRSLSTLELAHDTLKRSEDVHSLSDRSWDACGRAFIASIPMCIAGAVTLMWALESPHDPYRTSGTLVLALDLGSLLGLPWIMEWRRSIQALKAFTAEAQERTAELKRRNEQNPVR